MWGLESELLLSETLFERCNTAAGIEDTLLAGVERMAYGTYFNVDRTSGLCGLGGENFTATACNGCLYIFWVDLWLHG
jgi:hypothetical protein